MRNNYSPIRDGQYVEISCPECGVATQLMVRRNRTSDTQFLGCPNWPECDHTQPITEEMRMRAAGAPTLFPMDD